MIAFFLIACLPEPFEVQLSGQVLTAQDSTQGAPNLTVTAYDSELEEYSATETDDDGLFTTAVQSNRVYHLVMEGPDITPTAFSGVVGSADTSIDEDELFVRSTAETEALRTTHENCDASSLDGGIVEGVVHFQIQNERDNSYLIAEEAMVEVYDVDGTQYEACYLNNDGESLEAGTEVGATGRFAAFGIPSGAITVVFKQEFGELVIENYGFVFMPEEGIAPFHPAFIDLAG